MDMDIVQLARNYKEAQKALAKARKALIAAMDKDVQEAIPVKSKKATAAKSKQATPAKTKKTPPVKSKKTAIRGKLKKQSKFDWAPYRTILVKNMKKGQWITGFDARLLSGHEEGPGFTQNVLTHLLTKGIIKKRKLKTTTQWCLK